jgi:hypothetical protein
MARSRLPSTDGLREIDAATRRRSRQAPDIEPQGKPNTRDGNYGRAHPTARR